MKLTDNQKNEIHVVASGNYLVDKIPDYWDDMEEDELYEWIEDHAWEPFEHWQGSDIFEAISSAAISQIRYIERQKGY